MHWRLLTVFLWMGFTAVAAPSDSITVYLFLREDCVICQQYTPQLERLAAECGGKGVHFFGVFPNASSSPELIAEFAEKYGLTFPLETDPDQTLTHRFGVTITPEVVVYDHRLGQVLYTGRIDDRYVKVGKRRRHVQTSELEDALKAIRSGQPVAIREAPATGCLITLLE
ncbi:MAG: redoxin family protein [Saprospiraceae bacterium]|nr:redoxin family protein [Saprospiraceae bacterium]MDZ4704357.1 redoxin family protein [Saprospiraceae bacterium]